MLVVSEVSCLSCDVATTHHGVQGGLGLAQFPPAPLLETLGMSGDNTFHLIQRVKKETESLAYS